jgi:hypothetical protein
LDIITAALLILFGVVMLIETLLLVGAFGIIRDQNRKMGVIMANYKADLEMTLLNAHNFDEFIKHTEEAMKGSDAPPPSNAYS